MSQVHESRIYSVSILIFFFVVKVVSKSLVFLALAFSLSLVSPPGNCGMRSAFNCLVKFVEYLNFVGGDLTGDMALRTRSRGDETRPSKNRLQHKINRSIQ